MHSLQRKFLAVSAFVLSASGVSAQSVPMTLLQASMFDLAPESQKTFQVRSAGSYVGEGDFKDESGAISSYNVDVSFVGNIFLAEDVLLALGAGYNRFEFDYSGNAPIGPETLQAVSGIISLEYLVNGQPAALIRARPGFYYSDDIHSDAFDVPTVASIGFNITKGLIGVVGVTYSHLRKNAPVLPIAGFIWDINPQWQVYGIAPEPRVIYKPNQDLQLFTGLEITGGSYHLGDDLKEYEGDTVNYNEIRIGAGVNYTGWDPLTLEVHAGWTIYREMDYESYPDQEIEGAPYIKLKANMNF